MTCIVIPQGQFCVSRTFKPGDPEPEGYMDRIAWHKAQGRAASIVARYFAEKGER